jgi:DNA-binding IclR family transcriptional regulator
LATSGGGSAEAGDGNGSVRYVTSLLKALDVIDVLAQAGGSLGVSELARAAGHSTTSTYNIVNTLESRGLVVKETKPSRYRLGWRLHELGMLVAGSSPVLAIARPHLRDLAASTNETVMLGVLEGREVLYLDREESSRTIRMVADVGHRSPLHSNASGKVLLAHQPRTVIEEYLASDREAFTPATIVDVDELRDHLTSVVNVGYATCWQEREAELCSISVPVFDFSSSVVAALTIAGPASRIDETHFEHLLPKLRAAADAVSADLGARDTAPVAQLSGFAAGGDT